MFIPSVTEQSLLIQRFDLVDNKIDSEYRLLKKLRNKKSGLMHDLLTGKVPVTINEPEAPHAQ